MQVSQTATKNGAQDRADAVPLFTAGEEAAEETTWFGRLETLELAIASVSVAALIYGHG